MGSELKLNGFYKWLSSTKFQISMIGISLLFMMVPLMELDPVVAATKIVEIVVAYNAARILEPVVEFLVNKLGVLKDANYKIIEKIKP